MAIINCPQCGRQVSNAAPSCLHCGYKLYDYQGRGNSNKRTLRIRNFLIGYVVILLAILAVYLIYRINGSDVGNQNASMPEQIDDSKLINSSHEDKNEQLKLHDGYNYKIVNAEPFSTRKCNFYVRIQEQLSEDQIKEIAKQIRADYPSFIRLFIFYYLPEMKLTDGAWATSHYDTGLKVKIIGIKEKEERVKEDNITSSDILGKWYCNTPGVKHTITFFKDGNNLKAKLVWPFDHESIETIREGRNNRYIITSSKFGEYYILNSSGILELWDMDGKFGIATKE
jgi:hypothetical protein